MPTGGTGLTKEKTKKKKRGDQQQFVVVLFIPIVQRVLSLSLSWVQVKELTTGEINQGKKKKRNNKNERDGHKLKKKWSLARSRDKKKVKGGELIMSEVSKWVGPF